MADLVPGMAPGHDSRALNLGLRPTGPAVTVTVGAGTAVTSAWRAGNIGLSFELAELVDPRWEPGSDLAILVAGLGRPTLRFGGNSADRRVFWTSTAETPPVWAEVTITPADVQRLGRFARATGVDVVMTVDLGHNDPPRAADFAAQLAAALGQRLAAVSIGNEPNGFNLASQPQYRIRDDAWGPAAFLAQARAYERAMHQRTPSVPLVGPGTFDVAWIRAFAAARLPQTRALTQHWYPLWACAGQDPAATPTARNLLDPALSRHTAEFVGAAVAQARAAGLALWMEETGPTSCAGTNPTSRTHAHTLWTVEYLLHLAALGVQRTALHSSLAPCLGGAPMSPLCLRSAAGTSPARLQGGVGLLGAAFVAQVQPGSFVPVRVSGPDSGAVLAYAVAGPSGTDVVVVDLRDPATLTARPLVVTGLPGQRVVAASRLSRAGKGAADAGTSPSVLVPLAPATPAVVETTLPESATLVRFAANPG